MGNRTIISVDELERVKIYLTQEGEDVERMYCEYQNCVAELISKGITSGEIHDSLILYLRSAEILRNKFKRLSELTCEQIELMQMAVEESDTTKLY